MLHLNQSLSGTEIIYTSINFQLSASVLQQINITSLNYQEKI